jgi:hypothetical protein
MPKSETQGKVHGSPAENSVSTLVRYLLGNKVVSEVEQVGRQVIIVKRNAKSDIKAFLVDIYILGIADVHEILSMTSNLNAIVVMSQWNSYSTEAKDYCRFQNIGLFSFKEFLGAVYRDGNEFLDYIPPSKDKGSKTARRKRA